MFHHSVSHDLQPIILYIAIITYIPKIHQTANAIGMWQLNGLEALLLRFIFFDGQRKTKSPRLLFHGNHKDKFLFLWRGNPVRNQNFIRK